jgi:hypothetical protein
MIIKSLDTIISVNCKTAENYQSGQPEFAKGEMGEYLAE